jgi:hypothetical protein
MKFLFHSFVLAGFVSMGCTDAGRGVNPHGDGGVPRDLSMNPGLDFSEPPLNTDGSSSGDDGMLVSRDPVTCDEAAMLKSYIGCDYWPTVLANAVWSIFDYAVVVSNPGSNAAMVTVSGGALSASQTVMVPPQQLVKIYLPWVTDLKGGDFDQCTAPKPFVNSVLSKKGAYHLVASVPVLVYQFNALEYGPQGGPSGKDWSQCPGTVVKCDQRPLGPNAPVGCFSYSNDASLLLPSTAMTGNYRVTGFRGESFPLGMPGLGAYAAVTATQDNTTVKVKVSSTGQILASTTAGIAATAAGGTATITLNQGDVAELVSADSESSDLSGSLIQADKPVQVIAGHPCTVNPAMKPSCDHIEESVLPAETLGNQYVVTMPTGPRGDTPGHTVRFLGNVDGTKLTYSPSVPGAPTTLNAGQMVELATVKVDFMVSGDHEFSVSTVQLGSSIVDPPSLTNPTPMGDPSLSQVVAVAQYRTKYVFLAPSDYTVSYVDIAAPTGANIMLDGAAVTTAPKAISGTSFGVIRAKLGAGQSGAHVLTSDQPVGIQVVGYGSATSYQYPGGLDLRVIAPPPPPIS